MVKATYCITHLILLFNIALSNILKSTTFNGNSLTSSDLSITKGSGTTIDESGNWRINVNSQMGSDLALFLDESWKFDDKQPSTLTLIINGITPSTDSDGDFLILFSSNNNEFFSAGFHLDIARYAYKIYPNTNSTLAVANVHSMIYSNSIDRWQRYSQNDNWANAIPKYTEKAHWPLHFTVTNYPTRNKVLYEWRDGININNVVSVKYKSSFSTNKGLDIYIAGDSPNEQFTITNITILYSIQTVTTTTFAPTMIPTYSPTSQPSDMPINMPTILPTNIPSYTPTNIPSYATNVTYSSSVFIFNETKMSFDNVQTQSINVMYIVYVVCGLLLIIFCVVIYMVCIVLNNRCKTKGNQSETKYMKTSYSNSVDDSPKLNKRRESKDIQDNETRAHTLSHNLTDCSDIESESDSNAYDNNGKILRNNARQHNETPISMEIRLSGLDDNGDVDYGISESDNLQQIAHTIISGNATIGSRSYDLDSMLLSNTYHKTEWSVSLKLQNDTSSDKHTRITADEISTY